VNIKGIDMSERFDISKKIAEMMTSEDKQQVHLIIEDGVGSGMSWAGLQAAERIAKVLSKKVYGTQDRWEEFFNEKENIIDGSKLKFLESEARFDPPI